MSNKEPGYVYILTNPSFREDWVKIGKSSRPVDVRSKELYIQQLKEIFEHVTPEPLVLNNSRNTPIFHFACASNNPKAVKIATDIINKKQKK